MTPSDTAELDRATQELPDHDQPEEGEPTIKHETHPNWKLGNARLAHQSVHYRERTQDLFSNISENGKPLYNLTDYVRVSEQVHAGAGESGEQQRGTLIRVSTTLGKHSASYWTPTPFDDQEKLAQESSQFAERVMQTVFGPAHEPRRVGQ